MAEPPAGIFQGATSINPHSSSGSSKRKHEDSKIVWPPVVIIENTLTHFDEPNQKWKGLENEEIRSFLKTVKDIEYGRVIALYDRHGNRGKSLVIFPPTPIGYMDAETLCMRLEAERHGRHDWGRVLQRSKDPCGPERTTPDGKKILYGYLADERDMLDADYKKKLVKRWSMESYMEKVLEPLNRSKKDKEEARKKTAALAEEAKQKMLVVEQNKSEVGRAAAEFRKINEEIEVQKKREEELEVLHRRDFEQKKRQYEEEKVKKLDSFKATERTIRERLQQNDIAKQNAVTHYEELARRLQDGINMEKKSSELRIAKQKQMEMLEHVELDSKLRLEMEEKLAELEKKFQEKQLKLQAHHNEQIKKARTEMSGEKEKFLQTKLQELAVIDKEVKDARKSTQEQIQGECIICFEDFVETKRERAQFSACGHAVVCSICAADFWKQATEKMEKPKCPTCQTVQRKKYTLIPAKIYA